LESIEKLIYVTDFYLTNQQMD